MYFLFLFRNRQKVFTFVIHIIYFPCMHILPCCVPCHHQESHLSILCMLAVLVVAARDG